MQNHAHKTLILTTLLLLTIPFLSAQITVDQYPNTKAFTATTPAPQQTLCSCQTVTDQVRITNNGAFETRYTIQTNLPELTTPATQTVTIPPSQTVTLPININAPCNTEPRTQQYDVYITSTFNNTQRISRNLTINKCQSLNTALYRNTNQTTNPCQPLNYTVETTNPAPFSETYQVTTTQNDGQILLDEFSLAPGETQRTQAIVQYECGVYGEQRPEFTVTSVNNDLQTTLPDTVQIRQNYPYTVTQDTANTPFTCLDETHTQTYTVTNQAPFQNTYTIQATNTTTTKQTITLQPNASEQFTLTTPSNQTTTQPYTATITSQLGDVQQTINNTANYTSCYNTALTIQQNPRLCTGTGTHTATITNNGLLTQTYTFNTTTTTPNTTTQNPEPVTLTPGQNTTIQTQIQTTPYGIQSGELTIQANTETRTQNPLSTQQTTTLTAYDAYQCQLPNIDIETGYYSTQTVPITITNTGIKQTAYTITTNTTTFTPTDTQIVLGPGETRETTLQHALDGTQPYTETIQIQLEAQPGEQTYTEETTVTVRQTPWYQRFADYVQSEECAQTLLVLLVAILITLILGAGLQVYHSPRPALIAALIVLVLIVLTQGLPNILQPETRLVVGEQNLTITQPQGTTSTIDLSQYFQDPDNDNLTYTTDLDANHVIDQDQLIIDTANETQRTTSANLTATDTAGSNTSVPLTLTVTRPNPDTFQGIYEANCDYLNLLLIAALIAATATWTKRRDDQKTKPKQRSQEPEDDGQTTLQTEKRENKGAERNDEKETTPSMKNTKAEIKQWLDEHGIDYKDRMRKKQLLELVEQHDA